MTKTKLEVVLMIAQLLRLDGLAQVNLLNAIRYVEMDSYLGKKSVMIRTLLTEMIVQVFVSMK